MDIGMEASFSAKVVLTDSQSVCADSDGKIDRFISAAGSKAPASRLKLHELMPGEPYLLGMFLTGAYQEVRSFAGDVACHSCHTPNMKCMTTPDSPFRACPAITDPTSHTMLRSCYVSGCCVGENASRAL